MLHFRNNHIFFIYSYIMIYYINYIRGDFMNNADMNKLMDMLSKMDPKELESGIARANQLLQSGNKEEILNKIKDM